MLSPVAGVHSGEQRSMISQGVYRGNAAIAQQLALSACGVDRRAR